MSLSYCWFNFKFFLTSAFKNPLTIKVPFPLVSQLFMRTFDNYLTIENIVEGSSLLPRSLKITAAVADKYFFYWNWKVWGLVYVTLPFLFISLTTTKTKGRRKKKREMRRDKEMKSGSSSCFLRQSF